MDITEEVARGLGGREEAGGRTWPFSADSTVFQRKRAESPGKRVHGAGGETGKRNKRRGGRTAISGKKRPRGGVEGAAQGGKGWEAVRSLWRPLPERGRVEAGPTAVDSRR